MPRDKEFEGEVVAITGVGDQLGRAYAEYFSAMGAFVVVNDADAEVATEVAALVQENGGRAVAASGSLVDGESCDEFIDVCIHEFGRLDVLVNNPKWCARGSLSEAVDTDIRRATDDYIFGTLCLTRAACRVMSEQGNGRIVVTSSSAGAFGAQRTALYATVSAALIGFTRALALDLVGTGLTVNAVAPTVDAGERAEFVSQTPWLNRTRFTAESLLPVVGLLAHRDCPLHGMVLSAGGGRVARVASLTTVGHFYEGSGIADIVNRLDRVVSLEGAIEPNSVDDDFLLIDV